jgi:peptide-methionine (R)-S-oxide reductase
MEALMVEKVVKRDDEWRKELTPEQYRVTREKGTELPFSGEYCDLKKDGVYRCVCCGNEVFDSDDKYDSQSGWPSYTAPAADDSIETAPDHSGGRERTEVICRKCGAHLGHVFEDGPEPTRLRYCINSVALSFEEEDRE